MAIVKTRDQVADDKDGTILGELFEDGEVRDPKGNVIAPYRTLVNGKAVTLYFTEKNMKTITLGELSEIAENAPEDAAYRDQLLHDMEKRARKGGGGSSDGRRKYGTGPGRKDTTHIREWLRSQGVEISNRGRIPTDLMARYNNRSNSSAPPAGFSSADERSAVAAVAKTPKRPTQTAMLKFYNEKHNTKLKSLTEDQENEAYEAMADGS